MSDRLLEFPYRMRQDYLSPAESAFFHVLNEMVKGEFFVCPKVALTDLFFVTRPNENVHYSTKLLRKNVDFLFLRIDNLKPALAIELDYPQQVDHRPVDLFLDGLFAASGLPLIHVLAQQPYNIEILAARFRKAQNNLQETTPLHSDYSPLCPRCGITMVLRFDKDGPFNGQKYYGCLNFPSCQEIVPVGSET